MARLKLRLYRLVILLLLVALVLIYLVERRLSRHEEIQQLSGKANQLLKDINGRERRHQSRKYNNLEQELNLPSVNPFFRGPSHREKSSFSPPRNVNEPFTVSRAAHVQRKGSQSQKETKPSAPSQENNKMNKNIFSNNQSITEYIRTELLKREKEYQRKQISSNSVILGKLFNAEKYLLPQKLTDTNADPMKRFQFNQYASDHTVFNRTLWDVRNPLCKKKYEAPAINVNQLPNTSVIICFHNEARSALLRTVYSVLSRSPSSLLTEIILVDDFSDNVEDGELLTLIPKVKLIRLDERQGLIRARLVGANVAIGQVLTFLDSHCEVTIGWLEPLLAQIHKDTHNVVSPVIDIIQKDTMKYTTANSNIKGGFGHNLHFKWDNMSPQELQDRHYDNTAPIKTPAIAGGLFAIDKKYFEDIGTYDYQMEIWGGENVEISMRIWMCGGALEIIPCSHVGHIFRASMPYTFGPGKSYHTTVTRNLRRIAEVWMDDYKHLFYKANTLASSVSYGNISSRIELKKKLNCKPFSWYIDNIYPEFVSGSKPEIVKLSGYLRQSDVGCFVSKDTAIYTLVLANCNEKNITKYKKWFMTSNGRIKHHSLCLSVNNAIFPTRVFLSTCSSDKGQRLDQTFDWIRNDPNIVIKHKLSGLCLASKKELGQLTLQKCSSLEKSQQWQLNF